VVTVEKVVSTEEVRSLKHLTRIPGTVPAEDSATASETQVIVTARWLEHAARTRGHQAILAGADQPDRLCRPD
jgi:hypothetical protein